MGSYDNISKLFWEVEYELFSKVCLRAKFPRVSQDVLTRVSAFGEKKKNKKNLLMLTLAKIRTDSCKH